MKFFCEYCGCRIDAEKDDKCPNCGASYKKNKKFLEMEEKKKEIENKTLEFGNQIMDSVTNTMKFSKVFFIIPIIMFVVIAIIIFSNVIRMNNTRKQNYNNSNTNTQINETNNTEEKQDTKKNEKVTVKLNEYGKTLTYQVKVTGYEKTTYWYKEPKDGYEFVTFHLMVQNLTDKQINNEDVNCIVDGVAQTNTFSSGYSTIPFFIQSELTVTGDSTFEVPKNAKSYDIRYGDYVTIHIEK